jgi:hypothetical protein
MEQPRRELKIDDVRMTTHFNRKHFDEWIVSAERAYGDLDREARTKAGACRWCFYARGSRIGGAVTTAKPCDACAEPMQFASTATNRICAPCGAKLGLCVQCAGDINMTDRRKLERTR